MDFPVAGVQAQGNRPSAGALQPAMGAQNHDIAAAECLRTPAHPHVLAKTEKVAGGLMQKHVGREGQCAGGARSMCCHFKERRVAGIENRL